MRIKLYDKYTKKIKKKIRENYKIIYKNYITEESIAELSNNIKLKFKNEDLIKHYKLFKKNKKKKTSLKEFIILVGQYLKDKYYNYGYLILKENEDLNSTRFNFYIKIPRSII
jgi:hypothetical protein